MRRARRCLPLAALLAAMACLSNCSKETTRPKDWYGAQPPETEITFAPLDADTAYYRVHVYWYGSDKFGQVVRFRVALDADTVLPEDRWHSTTAKDTMLVLSVNSPTAVLRHVIKVAAEDDHGRIDPTPATRDFSVRTIPPTSCIVRGPSQNSAIGNDFAFTSRGTDPDGGLTGNTPVYVDTYETLLLRANFYGDPTHPEGHQPLPPYDEATFVKLIQQATGDHLPPPYDDWKWTIHRGEVIQFRGVQSGDYMYAVRAVDGAGAREENLRVGCNIRHFTIAAGIPTGPSLVIRARSFLGPEATFGVFDPRVFSPSAPNPVQIFEGETVSFSWRASADPYGGAILGYSEALDDSTGMQPPTDSLRTAVTLTPAQLTVGNHVLYVRVADFFGFVTNGAVPIQVIRPAFKQPGATRQILYVDDSQSPGAVQNRVGNFPSDAEETDWWLNHLLPELGAPYTEWDTYLAGLDDVLGRKPPTIADLSNYSTVIWNVDFNNGVASPTALWKTVVGGPSVDLAHYLQVGGTLILTGFSLGASTTNPRTTMYTNAGKGICATIGPGTSEFSLSYFPRDLMGVDEMFSGRNAALRTLGARDFVAAYPTAAGQSMGFDSASVDTGPAGSVAKWITYTAGDLNTSLSPGLPAVDGWVMAADFGCQELASKGFRVEDPSRPVADPIYRYHGARIGIAMDGGPSPREGYVVGVRVQAHDLGETGSGMISSGNASGAIGRTVHLGFPLYFLRDDDAKRLLQAAFNYVNTSPTLP